MRPVRASRFVNEFVCLGAECPDTCCKGWSMQLDDETFKHYQAVAPELLSAVSYDGEGANALRVMRRDEAETCVKLENGLCGIHKTRGADFLGDACYFYPRSARLLGDQPIMTAALSCPETVRLALLTESEFFWQETNIPRLPRGIKNYLPETLSLEDAQLVHHAFVGAAVDEGISSARALGRIFIASESLQILPHKDWAGAASFALKLADGRMPSPEKDPMDVFHLYLAAMALQRATNKPMPERLRLTLDSIGKALGAELPQGSVALDLQPDSLARAEALLNRWRLEFLPQFEPFLHRYIAAQLALLLFPFGSMTEKYSDTVSIIAVRYATLKLALAALCEENFGIPSESEIIRVTQSLSRAMDHLADPSLSLAIYRELGWLSAGRLLGIAGEI